MPRSSWRDVLCLGAWRGSWGAGIALHNKEDGRSERAQMCQTGVSSHITADVPVTNIPPVLGQKCRIICYMPR